MELKDTAVALAGIAVVMLALGYFTDGTAFYAAAGLALAVPAVDLTVDSCLFRGTVSAEFRLIREQ
jgi:hypothetical protein